MTQGCRIAGRASSLLVALLVLCSLTLPVPSASADEGPFLFTQPGTEVRARLIRSMEAVYVIDRGKRRWIVSPQVFTDYRFREEWIEQVPDDDLNRIGLGPDLVAGPVLRDPDGRLWIVYQGTRREVVGPDAYAPLYLREGDAVPVTGSIMSTYPIGRPAGNRPSVWPLAATLAVTLGGVLAIVRHPTVGSALRSTRELFNQWGDVAALLAFSAGLKFVYVSLWAWIPDGADAPAYVGAARFLMAGNSILTEDRNGTLVSVTSSAYPLILALTSPVTWLTNGNVIGWKWLQVVIATLIPITVGSIAFQIAGTRSARAATIIATLSPIWFYSAELLQYELWLGLAIAFATLATLRRAQAWHNVSTFAADIIVGAAWAVAVFTQVKTAVMLGPALTSTWWWTGGRQRRAISGLIRATVVASVAVTPILLWGARNVVANGAFVIGSTGSGTLLWIGNQPSATGGYMAPSRPPQFYDRYRDIGGPEVTKSARTFAAIAWDEIAAHPDHIAVLALLKLERFWWTITPDRLGEHLERRTLAFFGGILSVNTIEFISKLTNFTVFVLATIGIFGSAPNEKVFQRGARWLIISQIVVFWFAHIPFISEPRYRLPVIPLIQVFEGIGVVIVIDACRDRVGRARIRPDAVLAD